VAGPRPCVAFRTRMRTARGILGESWSNHTLADEVYTYDKAVLTWVSPSRLLDVPALGQDRRESEAQMWLGTRRHVAYDLPLVPFAASSEKAVSRGLVASS